MTPSFLGGSVELCPSIGENDTKVPPCGENGIILVSSQENMDESDPYVELIEIKDTEMIADVQSAECVIVVPGSGESEKPRNVRKNQGLDRITRARRETPSKHKAHIMTPPCTMDCDTSHLFQIPDKLRPGTPS